MPLLGFGLAALIGLSLGLLGGGGSILTVPVLVYVLGIEAKSAIAMSLPIVGAASLVGAAWHWRLGNVQLRTALLFGLLAMAGAFAGARLAAFVDAGVQLALLALAMLAAAASMMRRGRRPAPHPGTAPTARGRWLLAPVALGVGVLTGLVGIGGGFLVVPALVLLARVPMRQAVGTSLLVIALNSAAGFAGYLGSVSMDWPFISLFAGMAVAGGIAGAALTRVVPQLALQRGFAILLVVLGAFVLFQNRNVLRNHSGSSSLPEPAPAMIAAQ